MSKTKQFLPEGIDVTPEGLDELEAQGAMLILDYKTFAEEYQPEQDNHYDFAEA